MDPQSLELQVWPQCTVERIEEPQRPGGNQVLPLHYIALLPRWKQAATALSVAFTLFTSVTQVIWSITSNSEVTIARYAASSNVTAGIQDAFESASYEFLYERLDGVSHSAASESSDEPSSDLTTGIQNAFQSASYESRSEISWEIIGVIGLVGTIVLTLAHNEWLHWRNRKATKNEDKEKEVKKEKWRTEKEKKRREEKETKSREADRRNERLIRSLPKYASVVVPHRHQYHNLNLSAENRSDLSCHKMEHAGEEHDLKLRDDGASTSKSKAQV